MVSARQRRLPERASQSGRPQGRRCVGPCEGRGRGASSASITEPGRSCASPGKYPDLLAGRQHAQSRNRRRHADPVCFILAIGSPPAAKPRGKAIPSRRWETQTAGPWERLDHQSQPILRVTTTHFRPRIPAQERRAVQRQRGYHGIFRHVRRSGRKTNGWLSVRWFKIQTYLRMQFITSSQFQEGP